MLLFAAPVPQWPEGNRDAKEDGDVTAGSDKAAAPTTGGRIRGRAVPLIVATALLMENIDGTVIATSLPRLPPILAQIRFT